jgi:hypothetical protein
MVQDTFLSKTILTQRDQVLSCLIGGDLLEKYSFIRLQYISPRGTLTIQNNSYLTSCIVLDALIRYKQKGLTA